MRKVPVTFEAVAKLADGMRTEVEGRCLAPAGEFLPFEMATDEGPYHGGMRSAPPPLAYFTTALVTCFLTQMRAFAPSQKVELNDISVSIRIEWEARLEGKAPYTAHGRGIVMDIEINSPAEIEAIRSLIMVASKACYVEVLLAAPVRHRLKRDGDWVDMDDVQSEIA